jgi:hypothetical protein
MKILRQAKFIRENYGKSLISQFYEIALLRFSKNKVGSQEYYEFEAWDDKKFTQKQKLEFVGWRKEEEYGEIINSKIWNVVTSDKLIGYTIFRGMGLPYPSIHAVYHPYGREFSGAVSISDPEKLASYLRNDIKYPFFAKPGHGSSGRNSVACVGYDADSDSLILANNEKMSVADYVQGCHPRRGVYPWEAGFIFQELVRPAAECKAAFGPTAPGLRLITFNQDGRQKLFRAILKIPTGNSMTDNFGRVGEYGTIVAEVDQDSGEIVRALQGIAPNMKSLDVHPDTGAALVGFRIPNWPDYLSVLYYATRAFPGVRLQHWDIAVSDKGPIVYEMNTFGGFGLPQIATRRGFYNEEFSEFMNELARKYPQYRA